MTNEISVSIASQNGMGYIVHMKLEEIKELCSKLEGQYEEIDTNGEKKA